MDFHVQASATDRDNFGVIRQNSFSCRRKIWMLPRATKLRD